MSKPYSTEGQYNGRAFYTTDLPAEVRRAMEPTMSVEDLILNLETRAADHEEWGGQYHPDSVSGRRHAATVSILRDAAEWIKRATAEPKRKGDE